MQEREAKTLPSHPSITLQPVCNHLPKSRAPALPRKRPTTRQTVSPLLRNRTQPHWSYAETNAQPTAPLRAGVCDGFPGGGGGKETILPWFLPFGGNSRSTRRAGSGTDASQRRSADSSRLRYVKESWPRTPLLSTARTLLATERTAEKEIHPEHAAVYQLVSAAL